jgi:septal ring factor EnvC (AmiA/AmiB activator)
MRPVSRSFLPVLLLLLLVLPAAGQRKALEEKRRQLLKEIEQTSVLLRKTTADKEATLTHYVTLQQQIGRRRAVIETLQLEVDLLEGSIRRTQDVIAALIDDVDRLAEEYAQMARHAYRQKLRQSEWLFLLSAQHLNDAFRRWQYLLEYDRYRQKQTRLILETQHTLQQKMEALAARKGEKEKLLVAARRQTDLLNLEMSAKNRLLSSLKTDEARLLRQLDEKRTAAAQLNAAIEEIIREALARSAKPAAGKSEARPNSAVEAPAPTAGFAAQQGRLPWPVDNGVVSGFFGRQPHPSLPKVEIENNGIDISTQELTPVRAVFEGRVAGVQFIPGSQYMVILKHGDFYTVYANLEKVTVKKGDAVHARDAIGTVYTDNRTRETAVHFEIWKEKKRLNPQEWIHRQKGT